MDLRSSAILSIIILCLIGTLIGCSKKNYNGDIEKQKVNLNIESYSDEKGVKAIFVKNKKGIIYKYVVYGTTNYDEKGKDIVASAVTSLAINTVNSINNFADVEMEYALKEVNDKPYLECELIKFKSKSGQDQAEILMKALKLGLSDIEEQYGSQYIQVIEK